MFVSPPNSHVEMLAYIVMIFGGRAFRRRLGYEGLVNCTDALIEKTAEGAPG